MDGGYDFLAVAADPLVEFPDLVDTAAAPFSSDFKLIRAMNRHAHIGLTGTYADALKDGVHHYNRHRTHQGIWGPITCRPRTSSNNPLTLQRAWTTLEHYRTLLSEDFTTARVARPLARLLLSGSSPGCRGVSC